MVKKVIGALLGLGILIGLVGFESAYIGNNLSVGYNKGYMPEQPIKYSHKFHAGELGISCYYCHGGVVDNKHANVPSLNVCMNCHQNIGKASPELDKLKEAYFDNKPVEWVKVHMLPDHVKFNHAAHIRVQDRCDECKQCLNPDTCEACQKCGEFNSPEPKLYSLYTGEKKTDEPVNATAGKCVHCHGRIETMVEVYQHSDLSMGWCVNCHRAQEPEAPLNCSTCHY